MKVLLDTNIVLDYLGVNQGFTEDAEKVFDLAAKRKKRRVYSPAAGGGIQRKNRFRIFCQAGGQKASLTESIRKMDKLLFEWDETKNITNIHKHKISFEEAQSVFYDPYARVIADTEHSEDEERFIILGMSQWLRILIVCHCYRKKDEVVRIISARKANRTETSQYNRLRGDAKL